MTYNALRSCFMLTYYVVDTDNFIELYCVNKSKPQLHCNGKCALSMQQTEKDTQPLNTENRVPEILLIPLNLIHSEYRIDLEIHAYLKEKPSYAFCASRLHSGYFFMADPPPRSVA